MLAYVVRELVQRKVVTILCYHKLDPVTADRHLKLLRRKYNIISLRDYLELRHKPASAAPGKALILTFDDGHQMQYSLKPVLEKHRVPVTSFICSGITGTNRHFWFETPMSDRELARLKTVSDMDRAERLEQLGFSETREYPARQALSWQEVEDMKAVVDFQSHSVFHPILPCCSETRSAREIAGSKTDLEGRLGSDIYAIAYPNGSHSPREVAFARDAGYQCGLTLDFGFNTGKTPTFQLKRIVMTDDAGPDELLVRASGVWDWLKHAMKHIQRVRCCAQS